MKRFFARTLCLLILAATLGGLRQFAPKGISWTGKWPSHSTSSEQAYQMMAKPGDPPFIGLTDVIAKHNDPAVIFIDARATVEFKAGRIPNARNLPYYELDHYQDSALKDLTSESEIIIYCEGIGCELSFFLGRELKDAGYTNLHIFYGGYPDWKNAGQPIEK